MQTSVTYLAVQSCAPLGRLNVAGRMPTLVAGWPSSSTRAPKDGTRPGTGTSRSATPLDDLACVFAARVEEAVSLPRASYHIRSRPQRDSNPRFGLERATSWASGRWGRVERKPMITRDLRQ